MRDRKHAGLYVRFHSLEALDQTHSSRRRADSERSRGRAGGLVLRGLTMLLAGAAVLLAVPSAEGVAQTAKADETATVAPLATASPEEPQIDPELANADCVLRWLIHWERMVKGLPTTEPDCLP